MGRADRGAPTAGAHRRRRLVTAATLAAALLTAGCSPAGPAGGPTGPVGDPAAAPPPPVAAEADPPGTPGVGVPVDLTPRDGSRDGPPDGPREVARLAVGTPDGGALVLLGDARDGPGTRLVTVSADGAATGSLPLSGLTAGTGLHLLPGGAALVSGRLVSGTAADAGTMGHLVVDADAGIVATVPAVPLHPATVRVLGHAAVSPDGRTAWLYTGALADGRYLTLLSGNDLATGAPVAARDLFADLRALHSRVAELEPVALAASPAGGVALVVNASPPGSSPFRVPLLLAYDAALRPLHPPVPLAPAGTPAAGGAATARAAAAGPDGTLFVVLRGTTATTVVAVAPQDPGPGPGPEVVLALPGFAHTDALVVDGGRVLLPAAGGVRSVDLATGATTTTDLGCPAGGTVRALTPAAGGGAWAVGGCHGAGGDGATLWRVP